MAGFIAITIAIIVVVVDLAWLGLAGVFSISLKPVNSCLDAN